jgi:hypothetical protein
MCTLGFYLFSLYPGELRFGQTMWDKTQVLLETSWGTHLGTWEHMGTSGNKQKNPYSPSKRKKLDCS